MTFPDRFLAAARRNGSWVCVGLDPRPARLPERYQTLPVEEAVEGFLVDIVEATKDLVCCYKPNAAYFEALGTGGHALLKRVLDAIPEDIPVLLDAKRGDIGATAEAYATWAFDVLEVDAMTAHPYLGWDGVEPFTRNPEKGAIALVRTSNPSAGELQDLPVAEESRKGPLYEAVARRVAAWRLERPNVGAVAGATYPTELARVREILGEDALILVPGVGAQGGSAAEAIQHGANVAGELAIVSSSRGILYAPDPRDACATLRDELNQARGA